MPAAGNAKHYAEIVQQNSLLRRLLGAGQEIQGWVHERDGEPRELSERAEKLLFEVAHKEQASDFRLLSEILHDEVDRLEKLSTGELELTGTPSGFRDIDAITGGFQPGNLIIVAARPAMGKSALVANIAENVTMKHKRPVAFFSLEMSEVELAQRFIACRARISGDKLRKGQVSQKDWPKVVRACNELEQAPLWFDDSSDLGILDLRAKARRLHAQAQDQGGLGLIIVDYLQLMRSDDNRANRVEQVAPDEPRAEDPRPRARGPGARDLAALASARSSARRRGRSSPTCASRARSSRTPTWSPSSIARTTTATTTTSPTGSPT